ncbi:MAG: aminopeptidase [Flavobacteriaceae bacterium]|jgi:bleomycin hydrolase|nr:aminopeptidase [Flavobacteriaceae bacterium]
MNKIIITILTLFSVSSVFAQDDLINKIKGNKSDNANFHFTIIKQLDNTSIKNQGSSGTCWDYSGSSFIESEVYKKSGKILDIAEIYTARKTYEDKAKLYVLLSGALNYGDGGELHDVLNMYRKYGAIPQEVYTGLLNGAVINYFDTMQTELKAQLDSIVKVSVSNPPIDLNWMKKFSATLDKYLGAVPETFVYEGKTYTPQTFAKEVINLNIDDYIEISSYKDYPYYTQFVVPIPDNWSADRVYNVPMKDLTEIIDNALAKGYTVGWATDVSEPYFSWKNGVAYVPDLDLYHLTAEQKATLFDAPKPDKTITEDMRQQALNDLTTTDDHGMHIVGLAKDQTGKEYYAVKNSWGVSNDFQGYLYVTKPYVQYKTTAIIVNKAALPTSIKKNLKP